MIKIAPSILASDLSQLKQQLKLVEQGGADWIHIDVMDGQFVPNMTFGPKIVRWVRRITELPLDVHLMVIEPDHLIPAFIEAGADIVTVHVEAIKHLNRTINLIKNTGAKAGVTLNPGTAASSLEGIIDDVDLVLVMTVNPGYGGQKFITSSLKKVNHIAKMIASTGKEIYLEVDGGIDITTAPEVAKAGANVLVAGSAVFQVRDIKTAVEKIKTSVD